MHGSSIAANKRIIMRKCALKKNKKQQQQIKSNQRNTLIVGFPFCSNERMEIRFNLYGLIVDTY